MSKLIWLLPKKSNIIYSLYVCILLICIITIFFNNLIPDLPILFSGGSAKEIHIKELRNYKKTGTYIIDSNNNSYYCYSTLSKDNLYSDGYSDIENNEYIIRFLPTSKTVLKISYGNEVIYSIWFEFGKLLLLIIFICFAVLLFKRIALDLNK